MGHMPASACLRFPSLQLSDEKKEARHTIHAWPNKARQRLPLAHVHAEDVDPPPSAPGWGVQGPCLSGCGLGWQVRWLQQQRGLARYNCADSLDRTNVGSFFGAVQVRACACMQTGSSGSGGGAAAQRGRPTCVGRAPCVRGWNKKGLG